MRDGVFSDSPDLVSGIHGWLLFFLFLTAAHLVFGFLFLPFAVFSLFGFFDWLMLLDVLYLFLRAVMFFLLIFWRVSFSVLFARWVLFSYAFLAFVVLLPVFDVDVSSSLFFSAVFAVLWGGYFLFSERVKNTYRLKVREKNNNKE